MGKRRAGISSLTPDHKKLGIDPISMCVGGVQHGIGNLSKRAIRLVQILSRSEIRVRSYDGPKSWESKLRQFRDSTLGVLRQRATWAWVRWSNVENTIWGKVLASPEPGPW
jgi:hypothetical protein